MKKSITSLVAICFALFGCDSNREDTPGKVIIINGPSAAGKSSLQKEIQANFNEPYIAIGIDGFFDNILPDYYGLGERNPKGDYDVKDIRWVTTDEIDGKATVTLHIGPTGRKVIEGMHRAIAAYAKAGNNVVVDYIQYEPDWMNELLNYLEGVPTYVVGVKIPLEVIEVREAARSTSPTGHAKSHYQTVHEGIDYDYVITDSNKTPEEIALDIKNALKR